ncbi:MAG: hypothetical protein AB7O96_18890 [Pseudobdellovibrionaceae bacterium]
MLKLSSLLFIALFSASSFASTLVVCSATVKGKEQTAIFKIEKNGKFGYMGKNIYAKAKEDSIFYWLTQDTEESGAEWEKNFRAPNGYSVVEVGTTADSVTVGISKDFTKGFYKYRDLGSGNGNSELTMECSVK